MLWGKFRVSTKTIYLRNKTYIRLLFLLHSSFTRTLYLLLGWWQMKCCKPFLALPICIHIAWSICNAWLSQATQRVSVNLKIISLNEHHQLRQFLPLHYALNKTHSPFSPNRIHETSAQANIMLLQFLAFSSCFFFFIFHCSVSIAMTQCQRIFYWTHTVTYAFP